jgi:hypothetical protein
MPGKFPGIAPPENEPVADEEEEPLPQEIRIW